MLCVNKNLKFLSITVGIFISFTLYGVVQEIIFRGKYEDGGPSEMFTYSMAFTALQCIACCMFAKGLSLTSQDKSQSEKHHVYYFFIALFNVTTTVTANMALQWVSYPTQNVAKAARPIPVMIFGSLIGKKSYSVQKYFFVIIVVVGVGAFMFEDSKQPADGDDIVKGSYLIAISLLMDGLQGAAQDRLLAVAKPTSVEFMFNVNLWSAMILVSIMAVTGEGRDLVDFAEKHPSVIWQLGLVVFVGTFGYFFIAAMVANFGSLASCLVTTTRKFFTVFISVIAFHNALNLRQVIATVVIFTALILDALLTSKSKTTKQNEQRPEVYKQSLDLATIESSYPSEIDMNNKVLQAKPIG